MNNYNSIKEFHKGLLSNDQINLVSWELRPSEHINLSQLKRIKLNSSFYSFYEKFSSFSFEWHYKIDKEADVYGTVNIVDLDIVLQDWKDNIYFDDYDSNDIMRYFHPFDLFVSEAKVGIIVEKENPDTEVYFYDYSEDIAGMDLDMNGYLTMLLEAKGFIYWQTAILSILSGKDSYESLQFKNLMPQIFPDFTFKKFRDLFEKVRLTNN